MLVLRFFRFLFGYVCFTAQGGFPERFINLCRNKNISLWDLKSKNGIISACTDCMNYRKIRPAARRSGMRVRIRKKFGLPFFLNSHSHRFGIIIGIVFCLCAICILSTRIWSVDVTGNIRVPEEKIIEIFEGLGVKKGVAGKRLDVNSIEISALQHLPDVSWLNMNIDGCAAHIEIRETAKIEKENNNIPSDIVASRDGQIVILRPFSGTQEQKIGNPVLKGDLLISGIKENKDLTVSFCRAKGYIVARTSRNILSEQNAGFKAERCSGKKTKYIFGFLLFDIPIGKVNSKSYKEKSSLFINGVTLPFSLTRCTEKQTAIIDIKLNKNQTKLLSALRFFDECSTQFRFLKTENCTVTASESESTCVYNGKFTCLENIGMEIPMNIEETPGEIPTDNS